MVYGMKSRRWIVFYFILRSKHIIVFELGNLFLDRYTARKVVWHILLKQLWAMKNFAVVYL